MIPKDVRRRLRLSSGSRLTLIEEEGRLVLLPPQSETVAEEQGGILVFRGRLSGPVPDHREEREQRLDRFGR